MINIKLRERLFFAGTITVNGAFTDSLSRLILPKKHHKTEDSRISFRIAQCTLKHRKMYKAAKIMDVILNSY